MAGGNGAEYFQTPSTPGQDALTDLLDRLRSDLADRYAIEGQVAAGGMATIFSAEDLRHGRRVAIKVMRPELAAALGSERFLREIQIAANLTHPRILPLYDSGEAGGSLFYVMPLVGGETLQDRLQREGQLSLDAALRIARQVADALDYAHEYGVIHRDIKPANILLDGGHAMVADFGLARAVSAADTTKLTETGIVMGTPSYMSPEQASGDEEIDGRSDIYALACLLFEMLAGQPPFTGPTTESVVIQHVGVDPPSISTIRSNVPAEVAALIQRGLQKIPADRIATAGEFARELELASAHLKVSGPLATGATSAARVTSRRTIKPAYLGIAAVVVAGGVFLLSRINAPVTTGTDGIRMTVIPFENLGAPEDEYFAQGVTAEITSRLAGVDGLSIVGRQSAAEYTASDKTPQEIGDELGVDFFLQSTISWEQAGDGSSTVRIRPQLVRTEDASLVWGDVYDEDLTGVFEVQTSIAEQVVAALGVVLLEPERQALGVEPTSNLDAYDFWLRGNEYFNRPVSEASLRVAEDMYGLTLDLDPEFAEAAARLSMVHSFTYFYYYDRSEERRALALEMAELALALAPDLPEAHLAMGEFYYRGDLDYEAALREFEIGRRDRQDDIGLLIAVGAVERRRGNWEEAAAHLGRASDLELRRASNAVQAGLTHIYLRDFDEAERYFDRAIAVAPDLLRPRVWMARLLLTAEGDTTGARAQFEAGDVMMPQQLDPQAWWHWAVFRVLEGPSDDNFRRLDGLDVEPQFRHAAAAELHGLLGDDVAMRAHYDSARLVLEGQVRTRTGEARFHSDLGVALAGLGRADDAIREGQIATGLLPVTREAIIGPDLILNLALIYTKLGMQDEAVGQLEDLLAMSSALSAHWLVLDPIWAPLRGHSGFERIVAGADSAN